MSEQSAISNTPSEPVLCKMKCGFFGNKSTGECCSKCWLEQLRQKKEINTLTNISKVNPNLSPATSQMTIPVSSMPSDTSADILSITRTKEIQLTKEKNLISQTVTGSKKKKGISYKNLMAGITKGCVKTRADLEKEKESLRKVTGGGNFSKINRI